MPCGSFACIKNFSDSKIISDNISSYENGDFFSFVSFSHISLFYNFFFFITFSRQNRALCFAIDELAPEVIDKVKYVQHGDFSQLQELKTHSQEWAQRVRLVIASRYLDIPPLFCFLHD